MLICRGRSSDVVELGLDMACVIHYISHSPMVYGIRTYVVRVLRCGSNDSCVDRQLGQWKHLIVPAGHMP